MPLAPRIHSLLSLSLIAALALAACSGSPEEAKNRLRESPGYYQDPEGKLTRSDFRHMYAPRENAPAPQLAANEPPIPQVADILAAPRPPKIGESKIVSISVTEDVPLKDVLIELSRLADVDMEIDPRISGGIIFSAKNKPFNQVIERIANLAGLRYKMTNGVLRVEKDEPYIANYSIDFLNIQRDAQSNVAISTNVLSNSGGSSSGGSSSGGGGGGNSGSGGGGGGSSGGGSGLNSGSNTSVTSSAESDLWKQLLEGINQILLTSPENYVTNPDAKMASTNAPVPAQTQPTGNSSSGGASTGGQTPGGKTFYVINRQAGVLTISANERQHDQIKEYIAKLKANASAQVLIEAKIVEVALDDQFRAGIDWNLLQQNGSTNGLTITNATSTLNPFNDSPAAPFTINIGSGVLNNLSFAVQLLDYFGTTRTLSSPRLNAINNQQAVLTVAENRVYFDIKVEKEEQTASNTGVIGTTTYNLNSTVKTVPIGIILTIQPSINLESNEVTLNVRPTLSRSTKSVADPSLAFLIANQRSQTSNSNDLEALKSIKNDIPVVEVRELDSMLKLKSGQVMVIGGLMQQNNSNVEQGIPVASEIPLIGNLFKRVDRQNATKELIIFIRATIVNSNGNADNADQTIYKKFIDDPRPATF